MAQLQLYLPVKPKGINQGWGVNGDYYQAHGINILGHNGLDLQATHGQSCHAAHDGTVVQAYEDTSGGWGVVLLTNQAFDYNQGLVFFKTIYWHFLPPLITVIGQKVKTGDVIGYCDNTGLSTGDHLHFGLKPCNVGSDGGIYNVEEGNGYQGAIDPTPYLSDLFAEDIATAGAIVNTAGTIANQVATAPISTQEKLTLLGMLEKVAEAVWQYLQGPYYKP